MDSTDVGVELVVPLREVNAVETVASPSVETDKLFALLPQTLCSRDGIELVEADCSGGSPSARFAGGTDSIVAVERPLSASSIARLSLTACARPGVDALATSRFSACLAFLPGLLTLVGVSRKDPLRDELLSLFDVIECLSVLFKCDETTEAASSDEEPSVKGSLLKAEPTDVEP